MKEFKKFTINLTSGTNAQIFGSRVICVTNMFMVNQIPGDYCGHGLYVIKDKRFDDGTRRSEVSAFFPQGTWQSWKI